MADSVINKSIKILSQIDIKQDITNSIIKMEDENLPLGRNQMIIN